MTDRLLYLAMEADEMSPDNRTVGRAFFASPS